jgi:hypothetical protein
LTRRAANAPGEKETTVLDDATLEDIEDKARAATPGPWMINPDDRPNRVWVSDNGSPYCTVADTAPGGARDAAHIARADPPTVLALVAALRAARKQIAAHAAQLAAKDEEIAGLKAENVCDACVGSGSPVSGLPCMCGGTGKMSRAAVNLREQLITERQGWRRDCDRIVGKLRAKDKEIATERQSHAHTIEVAKNEAAWRKQLQTELAAERQLADDLNEGLRLWSDELHASESITGRFIAAELKRRFALAPTATPAADGDTGKETP